MSTSPGFAGRWPYAPPSPGKPSISSAELAARERALAQAPLFSGMPKRHLRSLARTTRVSGYPEGATVVKEGSVGSLFFVILEGRARVVKRGRTAARLEPGAFFGEISLLDEGPRTASVVSDTPIVCLILSGPEFRKFLADRPQVALRILRELASRLREKEQPLVG